MASKASGSEEEPLVPDDFDEDFYKELLEKMPEATKTLRQSTGPNAQNSADNVQRLIICSNRYKLDLQMEKQHTQLLDSDIEELKEQLQNAINLSTLDQDTIAELKNVIESAWKQKDAAQMREQAAQDEVIKIGEKLELLEQQVLELSDKRFGVRSKRDEGKEIESLTGQVKELNKRLQIQRTYATDVEATMKTLEEKNKEILRLLDETSTESYNCKKRIDQLQKELTSMKAEELKYTEQITTIKAQNSQMIKVKVRQNLQILSLKTNMEHLKSQYNAACNKLAKAIVELEYTMFERDKHKNILTQRTNLLKVREDEITKLKQENSKFAKSHENAARKYVLLEEAKQDAEQELTRLRTQMGTQDKEIESMRRVVHHFEKNNENLTKERDGLKRDLLAKHRVTQEIENLYQEAQHEIRSLKDAIQLMDVKLKKLKDDFTKLQKEKTKKLDEIQTWIDKADALQNEIHLKENYVIELKRTISDAESKCSKFQVQHDLLANEKINLLRNVQAVEDDKAKLKTQIANLQATVDNLKGKVTYRDGELSKLQLQIDKLEKERRMLKTEVRTSQLGQQHTRTELVDKKKENDRFSKSLQEDEHKINRLERELDSLMNDKNAINAALTKRNDDYEQLKNDLDNLQTAYDQTEKQFSQCQEDMRLMKIEIKNLRTERNVLRNDRENAADLRQELLQAHRLLNQERIKARALQEEMLTPMNVHRWRTLKGKDPEKMNLIETIQQLRRQILNQNFANLEQERALDESRQLYAALKEFMLKLPSHKVREELNDVRATLTAKQRKVKALMAELNIKSTDEKTIKRKVEEMKTNLVNAQKKLVEETKKKQKLLDERQMLVQIQAQCFSAPPNMQQTLGAGYKILGG